MCVCRVCFSNVSVNVNFYYRIVPLMRSSRPSTAETDAS